MDACHATEEKELCRACCGSGEGYYTTNDKCIDCNGTGVEEPFDECANCNMEIENTTKVPYVKRYCSNECYDEDTRDEG